MYISKQDAIDLLLKTRQTIKLVVQRDTERSVPSQNEELDTDIHNSIVDLEYQLEKLDKDIDESVTQ